MNGANSHRDFYLLVKITNFFNTEYGTCRCYGDPHCMSFDKRHTKYQGTCTYTMVRDGCTNGFPDGTPSFEIWADFFKINEADEVSWVKAVYIKFHGYVSTFNDNFYVMMVMLVMMAMYVRMALCVMMARSSSGMLPFTR